jgi:hypothetical protein
VPSSKNEKINYSHREAYSKAYEDKPQGDQFSLNSKA